MNIKPGRRGGKIIQALAVRDAAHCKDKESTMNEKHLKHEWLGPVGAALIAAAVTALSMPWPL